jgi:hypothetical protein
MVGGKSCLILNCSSSLYGLEAVSGAANRSSLFVFGARS